MAGQPNKAEGVPARRVGARRRRHAMAKEGEQRDLPSDDEAIEREAERSRKELDEVPPPGTDPLHEGP